MKNNYNFLNILSYHVNTSVIYNTKLSSWNALSKIKITNHSTNSESIFNIDSFHYTQIFNMFVNYDDNSISNHVPELETGESELNQDEYRKSKYGRDGKNYRTGLYSYTGNQAILNLGYWFPKTEGIRIAYGEAPYVIIQGLDENTEYTISVTDNNGENWKNHVAITTSGKNTSKKLNLNIDIIEPKLLYNYAIGSFYFPVQNVINNYILGLIEDGISSPAHTNNSAAMAALHLFYILYHNEHVVFLREKENSNGNIRPLIKYDNNYYDVETVSVEIDGEMKDCLHAKNYNISETMECVEDSITLCINDYKIESMSATPGLYDIPLFLFYFGNDINSYIEITNNNNIANFRQAALNSLELNKNTFEYQRIINYFAKKVYNIEDIYGSNVISLNSDIDFKKRVNNLILINKEIVESDFGDSLKDELGTTYLNCVKNDVEFILNDLFTSDITIQAQLLPSTRGIYNGTKVLVKLDVNDKLKPIDKIIMEIFQKYSTVSIYNDRNHEGNELIEDFMEFVSGYRTSWKFLGNLIFPISTESEYGLSHVAIVCAAINLFIDKLININDYYY